MLRFGIPLDGRRETCDSRDVKVNARWLRVALFPRKKRIAFNPGSDASDATGHVATQKDCH